MYWQRDTRYHKGGYWYCRIKNLEGQQRRYHDPENQDSVLRKLMRQQVAYRQRRVRERAKEGPCQSTG